ncbi:MAG: DNA-binding protein [Myxococcaceae bacterium]|nr:DNA-binding protein [Myxococcaceae bacterium]
MYREYAPIRELEARVVCVWHSQRTGGSPVHVVPDGCLDILWDGARLRVAGPDTQPVLESSGPRTDTVGLRFRAGTASSVLLTPASALCDQRVDLQALWGVDVHPLHDALSATAMPQAMAVLQRAVWARRASFQPLDRLVCRLIDRLAAPCARPELRTATLARELGVSERQLHRRTTVAVGYGPKLLARILRMQRVRTALEQQPERPLAALALALGFVDQAHLGHDARQLFGKTVGALRAEARRRAMSDSYKTRLADSLQAERP